jgi:hypothetical protein
MISPASAWLTCVHVYVQRTSGGIISLPLSMARTVMWTWLKIENREGGN